MRKLIYVAYKKLTSDPVYIEINDIIILSNLKQTQFPICLYYLLQGGKNANLKIKNWQPWQYMNWPSSVKIKMVLCIKINSRPNKNPQIKYFRMDVVSQIFSLFFDQLASEFD